MTERLQVIGLGMCTLDVLMRFQELPTWERGARVDGFQLDGGGPAGTGTVAAARLGARTGFVGTKGNDEAAELKMQSMVAAGVDISRVVMRQQPDDHVVLVFVDAKSGERMFAGVSNTRMPLQLDEVDREYLTSTEYLLLDGCHFDVALQAAQWVRESGGKVVLDGHRTDGPIPEDIRGLIEHVDVLISGSGFAKALTGVSDILDAGEVILGMGPTTFVQTEGENGCYSVTAEERFHLPAFAVDVVDTTGAGDVFHGAYIVGLLHQWNPRAVATFSSAASAIECTRLGGRCGIPTFDETMAFLKDRGVEI